jgi:hypothetical protein
MTRSNVVLALYAVGAAVIVITVAYVINQYFGEADAYDELRGSFDTLTAGLSFLRDLALGVGLGVLIMAFGWYLDRGR